MRLYLAALRVACLLLSLVIAAEARAANTDEGAAKAHFAAGKSFYKDKRYRDAISEFLQAYQLSDAVDLLYNIAVCYDAVDDPGRATIYFQRYLESRHDARERTEIEHSLRRLSARVGRLIIHAPPGAVITVDGVAIEVVPPAPLVVIAGSHHIVGRRNGESIGAVDVKVSGALSKEVTITPAPAAASVSSAPAVAVSPPPPPAMHEAPRPRRSLELAGITLIAVGGAALVGGIAGSVIAVDAGNDVSNESKTRAMFDPSLQSRGQHAALAADVLYGVGGAAAAAGVVLTAVGLRAARTRRSTTALFPLAVPGAAGVLVQGRFQ